MHAVDGSMCVFGVLAEVLYERKMVTRLDLSACYSYDGAVSLPPRTLTALTGGMTIRLIEMNDTTSFNKIANYIEKNI